MAQVCICVSGSHNLQLLYECELRGDSVIRGFQKYDYDGELLFSYDTSTRAWVAVVPQAQVTQHRWNEDQAGFQQVRSYLEETCNEWLQKYVGYGKKALQRSEYKSCPILWQH